MFKFLTVLSLFSFMTSTFGQHNGHEASTHNHGHTKPEKAMSSVAVEELTNVLKVNDQLFENLLGKDQAKVDLAAKALANAINSTKSAELKGLRAENLLSGIKKINTKEKNLEVYSKVVPKIVELVKVIKPEGYSVYYCPMIKKEWIQNEKKHAGVKNVFAQEMLECGGKV